MDTRRWRDQSSGSALVNIIRMNAGLITQRLVVSVRDNSSLSLVVMSLSLENDSMRDFFSDHISTR
ncbi:hypothetical protein Hamer_G005194 [Homarus americanus]|uniref:Uncharacterized protein n=1 Tax=Homarus americanus TaxID=6706 RepID=A0A8J5JVB2_HOMAM|nr:hypothetical protein Hamer_G005194 [Homarus americanus]